MLLNQLRYVIKVHECGSISKAAELLFITQPSLSQQIMLLEKELCVQLFIRHKRGVTATQAGEGFAADCAKIISDIDNMLEKMKNYAPTAKGKIKVGVLWIFADLGLAELLSDFCKTYPDIETKITVDGSVKLLEMLKNRELDVIFYIDSDHRSRPDALHMTKMYDADMVLLLPAEHRLAQKEHLHITDIEGENVVLPDKDSAIYARLIEQLRFFNVKPRVIAQSSQTDITIACAENGMAISFVSDVIARKYRSVKTTIRPFKPLIKREVFYATLEETLAIPAVRLLTEFAGLRSAAAEIHGESGAVLKN